MLVLICTVIYYNLLKNIIVYFAYRKWHNSYVKTSELLRKLIISSEEKNGT